MSVHSLTEMGGNTVAGVVSLGYIVNGFVSDRGYDFYVMNGLAQKVDVCGEYVSLRDIAPPDEVITDEELTAIADKNITLDDGEKITGQRILRKYKGGKYIVSMVTEIESASGISRSEYFEIEL